MPLLLLLLVSLLVVLMLVLVLVLVLVDEGHGLVREVCACRYGRSDLLLAAVRGPPRVIAAVRKCTTSALAKSSLAPSM